MAGKLGHTNNHDVASMFTTLQLKHKRHVSGSTGHSFSPLVVKLLSHQFYECIELIRTHMA